MLIIELKNTESTNIFASNLIKRKEVKDGTIVITEFQKFGKFLPKKEELEEATLKKLAHEPVSLENLWFVRTNFFTNLDLIINKFVYPKFKRA